MAVNNGVPSQKILFRTNECQHAIGRNFNSLIAYLMAALAARGSPFPVLMWKRVGHVGSHVLGKKSKRVPPDFHRVDFKVQNVVNALRCACVAFTGG